MYVFIRLRLRTNVIQKTQFTFVNIRYFYKNKFCSYWLYSHLFQMFFTKINLTGILSLFHLLKHFAFKASNIYIFI